MISIIDIWADTNNMNFNAASSNYCDIYIYIYIYILTKITASINNKSYAARSNIDGKVQAIDISITMSNTATSHFILKIYS